MGRRRRRRAAAVAVVVLAGCAPARPPDTRLVPLTEVDLGVEPWRLEGRRVGGRLCASLVAGGLDAPVAERCGLVRNALRHLEPVSLVFNGRLVLFSALPSTAQRVRIDGASGSLHIQPARQAPGYPGRFFIVDLDPTEAPVTVRIFGRGGRAITP